MKLIKLTNIPSVVLVLQLLLVLSACSGGSMEGRILLTEVPQNGSDKIGSNNHLKVEGTRIVALLPGGNTAVNLTEDFISAASPAVSYDGENMLFSAKKESTDHFQIFELKLSSGKVRQITSCEEDCTNPIYLPIGRFAFIREVASEKVKNSNAVFTGMLDGTNIQQVTFSPQRFSSLTALNDGRILSLVKTVYPEEGAPKLLVMRPDGTKLELFYKSDVGTQLCSGAVETSSENLFFVEGNDTESRVASVSYNLPLHSHKIIMEGDKNAFLSLGSYLDDRLLLSYKKTNSDNYILGELNPVDGTIRELYKSEGYNVIGAVLVQAYQRPKNLPSEVQPQEHAGLLLCQDINFLGIESLKNESEKAQKIEILGIDSTLGVVDVEDDGSFYLKVEANMPFRVQTLSADNKVINGPGSWYYIRPNERRACVGCHTGPEISPFNKQPLAVTKNPVIIKNNSELKLTKNTKDYEH